MATLSAPRVRGIARRSPGRVVLYHTTPAARLRAIFRRGILPGCSPGPLPVAWLHTPGWLAWAVAHVRIRHSCGAVVSRSTVPSFSTISRDSARPPAARSERRRVGVADGSMPGRDRALPFHTPRCSFRSR
jgi:hypothetical protein